jgi:hypothetical protein
MWLSHRTLYLWKHWEIIGYTKSRHYDRTETIERRIIMAYKKPKSTVKKGKGPSRSQQRAGLAQKMVKSRLKPGSTASGQLKKDLTKRAREHIIESYKKRNPKWYSERIIDEAGKRIKEKKSKTDTDTDKYKAYIKRGLKKKK